MKTPTDFISELHARVVDENTIIYQQLLSANPAQAKGAWQQMIQLFATLDQSQKDAFVRLLRQVSVDSVSSVLLVIDENSMAREAENQLRLFNGVNKLVSGDLQDSFLAEEERKGIPF